ncbi:HDL183Cp [Eremothecium sinecaudum]|uniref:HDL183Cp n=1 Tax=Eremothecium sinecaudum TaxID=45286 RepID=A0A0X8HRB9_9SACH|nr:HDL183Cp [Eremothecium sinecaudum]AMD20561.1 HDL183Cp [Eremothecium sinecaudum]
MVKLKDMSVDQISDGSPDRKSKRNRISFVCQACRKSKTKCDREKPVCSRCEKNNIRCVYDIEKQRAPRVPSKDATIKRLAQELEYWKKKAGQYMGLESGEQLPRAKRMRTVDSGDEQMSVGGMDSTFVEDYPAPKVGMLLDGKEVLRPSDIMINFCEQSPQLLMKSNMKRDIKASCELAQVRQDKFLSLFISSVFASASKNALIHSIPSQDSSPNFENSTKRQNAMTMRDTMFRIATTDREREQIIQFTDRMTQGNSISESRAGFYIRMFTGFLYKHYIEDHCSKGAKYSDTLRDLIVKVEMFLPPLKNIRVYLLHFYKYVYPVVPFLEMDLFEATLADLLIEDPIGNGRVKLNIGYDNIRSKVETISILLIVLKLSWISMHFAEGYSQRSCLSLSSDVTECLASYPISDEAVTLSQRAIVSVNLFIWSNENTIACLLYLWAYFVFAPQQGDFGLGQPTEVILSLVNSMAMNIGLHRDPSMYAQLNDPSVSDPRVRNYHRKLWMSISITCRYETGLRGKYAQGLQEHTNPYMRNPEKYMEKVWADMQKPDPYCAVIHSCTFKKYQLLLMMSELDDISVYGTKALSLEKIEALLQRTQNYLDTEIPSDLTDFSSSSEFMKLNLECCSSEVIDIMKVKRILFYQTYVLTKLSILKTVTNLMLYFEKLVFDNKKEYMPYFLKYFLITVKETVQFTDLLVRQINCEIDDPYLLYMKFCNDKTAQLSVSTVLFCWLTVILRMIHSEYLLQKELQNGELIGVEDVYTTKQKLQHITAIKENTIEVLDLLCTIITKKLGLTYFSVFQILVFFDYCNQIIKKGEVLNIFSRVTQLTYHPKLRNGIYQGFGVDVNKKDNILQFLNDTTFIRQVSIQQLKAIVEFSGKIPLDMANDISPMDPIDTKISMQSTNTVAENTPLSVSSNLPFPVNNELHSFVVGQNGNDSNQEFSADFQNFSNAPLEPLISFDDLELLDYEFLFGNIG